ncbi:sugar MFS transporter [Sphingopyxis sp. GW247-27LB]|uniref:sugar MFS transporter n=1 Tax=Sphingopyxis sp. GW247-27LB TaxID=2012632 RepID=UPI000BA5F9BF|nr:sugar MFS transporter [Sphingopyxis sp. GW247-27LB]PAL21736.1 glucose/galactose MFS transporter [Sphingopyxis sp. GW247-27LB]
MAMAPTPVRTEALDGTGGGGTGYAKALTLLATLFFMWGFITVINNTLLPHLRSVFDLNYFQTGLIESVWFIGYLLASIPAAKLIERIGYQRALTTGLTIMTLGSLGMILAANLVSYGITIASLFVVSCGIALLQVAANPYVAVIGPPESSERRLTLVQAFNTTGDVLAILFGKYLILARTTAGTSAHGAQLTPAQRMADAQATELPYLIVAVVLALLAILIARTKLPVLSAATRRANAEQRKGLSLWNHRNLVLGCVGIALCVLAEIGVSSYFINFVSQPDIADLTQEHAASYLTLFWGGMMVGRFAGAALMRKIAPEQVLALFALIAIGGTLVATLISGPAAMYGLIVAGLGISIMFPAIFALAIRGLGPLTEEGSGLLIMSIAGGAFASIQGKIGDAYGLHWGFVIPAVCCLYVLFYALWGSKPTNAVA